MEICLGIQSNKVFFIWVDLIQVGEIISRFEKKGFKLTGLKLFQCPRELAEVSQCSYFIFVKKCQNHLFLFKYMVVVV